MAEARSVALLGGEVSTMMTFPDPLLADRADELRPNVEPPRTLPLPPL
jgi:hypothetical protein